ncbi:MAG: Calx-beta domain-containing protein [Bdellovibrionota bacterium]
MFKIKIIYPKLTAAAVLSLSLIMQSCGPDGNYLGKSGGGADDGHRPSKSPFYVDTPTLNLTYPNALLSNVNNPLFQAGNVLEGNQARFFTDKNCTEGTQVTSLAAGSSGIVDYRLSLTAGKDDGAHQYYVNVLDEINGYSECVGPATYLYDGTAPKFVDNSPADSSSIALSTNESTNDILIYDDNACSSQVGQLLATESGNDYVYAPTLLTNGIYAFYAQTTDIAMNLSACFGPLLYIFAGAIPYFDIDPPSTTIINNGDIDYNLTYYNYTSVDLQVADVIVNTSGSVTYTVAVTNGNTGTPTITVTITGGNGSVTGIDVLAGTATDGIADAVGNSESTAVTVDNTPPTVSIGAPSTTAINTGNIDYAVTYTGTSSLNLTTGDITVNDTGLTAGVDYTVSVLNGTTTTPTIRISVSSGDGTIDSVVIAGGTSQDTAGNLDLGDTESTSVTVDNTAPVMSIGAPSTTNIGTGNINYNVSITGANNYTLNGGDITVNATGLVQGVDFVVALTNQTTANPTITIIVSGGDGTIDSVVVGAGTASDNAGNTDAGASDNTTVNVLNNLPVVNFSAASQSSVGESGTLTVTAQIAAAYAHDVTVPFSIDGASTASDPADYSITASPIVITSGNTSANITITIASDTDIEGDETVIINMGSPTNATAGPTNVHTATITDDDTVPTVTLSVDNANIAENGGTATFTATLSAITANPVIVNLTASGTATGSGTDYTITGTSIFILPGTTTGSVIVTGQDDALDEANETVIIDIDTVTNATESGVQQATTTILDDDATPTVSFVTAAQTTAESGTVNVVVQLSAASSFNVDVPFSINGASTAGDPGDYSIVASPVTIAAGSTSANIALTIVSDATPEPDETVIIDMGVPTNATQGAITTNTVTISESYVPPSVTFTSASQTSAGESGTMTITAQLSSTSVLDVLVPFSVSGTAIDPDDYAITASPITITAGNTTADITITIAADTLDEANETVIVTMGSPTNATQGATTVHTATITDDDATPTVTLAVDNANIAEAGGTATFTATLSAASSFDVTVNFAVNAASTASGSDYVQSASSVVILAGNTTGSITVTGQNDALDEVDETVIIDIASVVNALESGTQQATTTITDDDAAPTVTLAVDNAGIAENGGVATFTATLSSSSGQDVTVNLAVNGGSTASGADYTLSSTSIVILAGNVSGAVTVTGVDDALFEAGETVIIDIDSVVNATESGVQQATTTINDDETGPNVTLSVDNANIAENGGIATFTATLDAVSGQDVIVNLTTSGTATGSGTDYTQSASSITILAGNLSGSVTVTGVDDALDELDETVIIDIASVVNGSESGIQQEITTITDDDAAPTVSLSVDNDPIAENAGVATFTATLSAASSQNVTVNLLYSGTATGGNVDYSTSTSSIVILAGNLTGTAVVTSLNDNTDENDETVIVDIDTVVNASENGIQQQSTTITDDDAAPTVNLILDNSSIAEASGVANFSATLSAASDFDVTVNLAFSGTATGSGTDYTSTGSSILILAGNTVGSVTVTAVQDLLDENDETIIVDIASVVNGTENGVQQRTSTILDDDATPTVSFIGSAQTVAESGTAVITAQLSAASGLDVDVPFTVNVASTATDPGDYSITASPVTITAGSTTTTITLTIVSDATPELDETVIVDMGVPTNATQGAITTHTVTISESYVPPTVAWTAALQSSVGESGTMTVTAQLSSAAAADVIIPFTLSGTAIDPDDYSITASPITILTGNTTANVTITIAADTLDEANETVVVTMGAPTNATLGATTIHTATITDDDATPTVTLAVDNANIAENGGIATFTASLSAASGQDITINLATSGTATGSGTDYNQSATSISILAGNTTGSITVTAVNDALDEANETVIIDIASVVNATESGVQQATTTILDDDATPTVILAVDNANIAENGGIAIFTATLSAASGQDVTINLATSGTATGSGTDYNQSAASISILAGNTTGSVTVTGVDDALDEVGETVIIDIDTVVNATESGVQQATTTITDDDATPTVTLAVDNANIVENGGIAPLQL